MNGVMEQCAGGYELTISDFFAGAGGSSTGMMQVPGVHVVHASNHWQLVTDIHAANHPNTDHSVVDLHKERPSFFPKTDVGWFSPECTKWSQASGKAGPAIDEGLFEDPLSDDAKTRSRLLMFDVLKFIEYHRYRLVIVENVVDIATQSQYRTAWDVWRHELRALGYDFRVVSLNSMHAQLMGAPAPQSRDRIYIVAWPVGAKAPDLDRALRPRAYCARCNVTGESVQSFKPGKTVGRYKQAYLYCCPRCGSVVEPGWLPAIAAIDWSIPGTRVGDRLKPKTRTRIAAGIARYWGPIHLEASGNQYDAADPNHLNHGDPNAYYRAWPVSDPFKTLHTRETKALAVPVEGRDGKKAVPVDMPFRTLTTRAETAFVTQFRDRVRDLDPREEPLRTIVADGANHALVQSYYGNTREARPVTDPLGTLTTVDRYALIQQAVREDRKVVTAADLKAAEEMVPEVLFRMFQPHEVAAGMAFPRDYKWQPVDRIKPVSNRDLVKAAGNAVTPPSARDILGVSVESMFGINIERTAA